MLAEMSPKFLCSLSEASSRSINQCETTDMLRRGGVEPRGGPCQPPTQSNDSRLLGDQRKTAVVIGLVSAFLDSTGFLGG